MLPCDYNITCCLLNKEIPREGTRTVVIVSSNIPAKLNKEIPREGTRTIELGTVEAVELY